MSKRTPSTESAVPTFTFPGYGKPPEIVSLLARLSELIADDQPEKALELIRKAKVNSAWISNATGVCQLRLGNAQLAVDVFRRLVLSAEGVVLRTDVPVVFKTNYATALLLARNVGGASVILDGMSSDDHPAVPRLLAAIRQWIKSLSFWQKVGWHFGTEPDRVVQVDFPMGDLE